MAYSPQRSRTSPIACDRHSTRSLRRSAPPSRAVIRRGPRRSLQRRPSCTRVAAIAVCKRQSRGGGWARRHGGRQPRAARRALAERRHRWLGARFRLVLGLRRRVRWTPARVRRCGRTGRPRSEARRCRRRRDGLAARLACTAPGVDLEDAYPLVAARRDLPDLPAIVRRLRWRWRRRPARHYRPSRLSVGFEDLGDLALAVLSLADGRLRV